ncbi:MAG: GTPase Era [Solirubrobacteraceae bacterium]|nr:GTPase Era [Solirubrobacteraceae bacterium]MDP4673057.1 GTPase Era [Solirubrobacteraceae bacterium]MDP4921812.1 GTPase Era [Solirubrobacteraceae bacterium]
MTKAGFVGLAGRPNVGKSTLVNQIIGEKVVIVSDRPQTTRRAIRGIAMRNETQLVMVDLPGFQRPRDLLTERMQRRVERELSESDAVLFVLNGEEGVGAGDRFIAQLLKESSKPVLIAVNKGDRLNRSRTMKSLLAAEELGVDAEIFPISAKTGEGVEPLVARLAELMPEGPLLFGVDDLSDQPLAIELAELIREQILRRTFQELPHAVEVVVEEIEQQREGLLRVRALAWVESESQKGILVGRGGKMVRAIGTAARGEIENRVGSQVHLDLSVRVRRSWRTDEGLLDRLGID